MAQRYTRPTALNFTVNQDSEPDVKIIEIAKTSAGAILPMPTTSSQAFSLHIIRYITIPPHFPLQADTLTKTNNHSQTTQSATPNTCGIRIDDNLEGKSTNHNRDYYGWQCT